MVRAWLLDFSLEDPRLEHQRSPPQEVPLESLKKTTGVLYWQLSADLTNEENLGLFEKIKSARGYLHQNLVEVSLATLPNYHEKLVEFYGEHLHADEEIRFILDGSGYFDVRNVFDEWVRILVTPGDLIVLPAGIYHRFTLDTTNYIKALRLSVSEPVSIHHNRPVGDEKDCRKNYLATLKAH